MVFPKFLSTFRVPRYILELKKSQYQRPSDLEKVQSKKLRKLVRHAYYHVPFYHFLFKKLGIKPSEINSVADLTKLPIISKDEILQKWGKFISNTAHMERCKIFSTSGTTGTPLRILVDRITEDIGYALVYYVFFECGMRLSDSFLELTAGSPSVSKCTFRHGPGRLLKGSYLSVFNDPAENVDEIVKINPDVIYSYPTALECIIEDYGSKMSNLEPKLVFTQAEMLTEKRRKLIENTLNVTPNDTYGSREFPRIAFECNEHQGLHAIADWIILELVKNGETVGPNEQGEIIVTSLFNYAMPFIRYKLGDLAMWANSECACGRSWPFLKKIEGRSMQIVTLPSGRRVPFGVIIWPLIKTVEGIKRFQIVFQQSNKNVIVRVVCNKNINKKQKGHIQQEIIRKVKLAFLNEDLNVEVMFVNTIRPQPSGKIPDFILEK